MHTIGVDTGGTFTDLVRVEGEDVRVEKLPSTPDDPSRAVLHGVERLGGSSRQAEVVHGTTVALNALLTGEVAPTALVINEGFADLIEIGRQERPELYALEPRRVAPIVERARRFEVDLRLWPDGAGGMEVTGSASEGELERLAQEIASSGAQAVSICLLHSYADPSQERLVGRALEGLGIPVTLSSSILPEYREVERFSTACVNASLSPLMGDYLRNLQESLPGTRLSILQSTGGTIPAARAAREPARILLSGPAGGVVGAAQAAREAGLSGIITLDMGGTSTDVAFHDSSAEAQEAVASGVVAGHAIGLPSLDVHTIGCGGGSIVRVDAGGILRVGPESAGADPGPICYGRGTELTVTDAHVALGHISCGAFVGGSVELDGERVERAFEELGARLGITPTAAALAVLEVARAAMRRAIGVRTMQRGHDPRDLPLVAFGGAGGLQAVALAEALDLPGALVPKLPGCLSAYGMARADAISDHSRTILAPLEEWPYSRRREVVEELLASGARELREAELGEGGIESEVSLELRYEGQSFELAIAERGEPDPARRFHELHEQRYGWRLDGRSVELVNVRARSIVRKSSPSPGAVRDSMAPAEARTGRRFAHFGEEKLESEVIDRDRLLPGNRFEGPCLIEEYTGTTILPPGWLARVTRGGHLWMSTLRK